MEREPWSRAGDTAVDSDVVLVLTRFGLRSPRHLIPIYLDYRRLRKQLTHQTGLIHTSFVFEDLTNCMTLSLWRSSAHIARLRQGATTHQIPVILVSTTSSLLDRARKEHAAVGGDRYLVKPFDLEDLLTMVRDFIGTA